MRLRGYYERKFLQQPELILVSPREQVKGLAIQ